MKQFSDLNLTQDENNCLYKQGAAYFYEEHMDTFSKLERFFQLKEDSLLDYKDLWRLDWVITSLEYFKGHKDQVLHECHEKLNNALIDEEKLISHNRFEVVQLDLRDFNLLLGAVHDETYSQTSLVFMVSHEHAETETDEQEKEHLLQIDRRMYFGIVENSSNFISFSNISEIKKTAEVLITLYCEVVHSTRTKHPIYIVHDYRVDDLIYA